MMKAGKLRYRVTIKAPPTGRDAAGQPSGAWSTFASDVPANILFVNGLQTVQAGAQRSKAKASIRLRYREDLTAAMRVEWGSFVFQIQVVLPDLAKREHVDLACEVVI